MDSIDAQLADPVFWFVPVFIGFIVGVAAAFGYDAIKAVIRRYSSRLRTKNEARAQQIEVEAQKCALSQSYFAANNAMLSASIMVMTTNLLIACSFLITALVMTFGVVTLINIGRPSNTIFMTLGVVGYATRELDN